MNYNAILHIKGQYIIVMYTKMYESIAKMVLQHYDNKYYNRTAFVVNVLVNEYQDDIYYRDYCPNGLKYIYYQLDNLYFSPECVTHEHMDQFDEIWDCHLPNLGLYPEDVRDKVVFMPLRYVSLPKIEPKEDYRYDLCFIGTLTQFRQDRIFRITKFWTNEYCSIKYINGYPYSELYDEIGDCKYIINIARVSDTGFDCMVNSPLMVEAICSGKQCITEINYNIENPFGDLVLGYCDIQTVPSIVKNNTPVDVSESFKNMTDNDYDYENYRKNLMGENYKQILVV